MNEVLQQQSQQQYDERLTRASSQDKLSNLQQFNNARNAANDIAYVNGSDDEFSRDVLQPIRPKSNTMIMPMKQMVPIEPKMHLNNSVSYEKPTDLNVGSVIGISGAGGRALLHDLDNKFAEHERLIKHLMNHNSNLELQLHNVKDAQYKLRDGDLGNIGKLEAQVRHLTEEFKFADQEKNIKLKNLED